MLRSAVSSPEKPELPQDWNISQDVYALQYSHKATEQTCLVKAIPMGETLLISAVVSMHLLGMDRPFIACTAGGQSGGQGRFTDTVAIQVCQGMSCVQLHEVSISVLVSVNETHSTEFLGKC